MSKQPDKERRTKIATIVTSSNLSPLGKIEAIEDILNFAQLQLVDELMEQKIHIKQHRDSELDAVPLSVLQQYKANLSGKGE